MKNQSRNIMVATLVVVLACLTFVIGNSSPEATSTSYKPSKYSGSAGNAYQLSMKLSGQTANPYRPSLYSGSAGNASQVSMLGPQPQASHTPSYGMSAGNAYQLSMNASAAQAASGYKPSKYSGSAGNAYQLSGRLLVAMKAAE